MPSLCTITADHPRRKGFTLVEISMVLVIIGLLIGGILAGQSMVETSNLHNVIKDISHIKVMIANFKTAYNCLPGDCVSSGSNNDGRLDYNHDSERVKWQLKEAGMVNSTYDFAANCTSGSFQRTPMGCNFTGSISDSVMTFNNTNGCAAAGSAAGCDLGYGPFVSGLSVQPNDNYVLYGSASFIKQTLTAPDWNYRKPHSLFTPAQALAIDKKIDDGMPNTGQVLGWYSYPEYTSHNIAGITGWYAKCQVNINSWGSAEMYKVEVATKDCGLAFLLTRDGDVVQK